MTLALQITRTAGLACTLLSLLIASSSHGQSVDCDAYARDYANARTGSGDLVGDAVDGGMRGAVVGGAWAGPRGARRGARAGGALGVLDTLGSMPGGWEALYDMAYQICLNDSSGANVQSGTSGLSAGSGAGCRSSATTQPVPRRPDGSLSASSHCR